MKTLLFRLGIFISLFISATSCTDDDDDDEDIDSTNVIEALIMNDESSIADSTEYYAFRNDTLWILDAVSLTKDCVHIDTLPAIINTGLTKDELITVIRQYERGTDIFRHLDRANAIDFNKILGSERDVHFTIHNEHGEYEFATITNLNDVVVEIDKDTQEFVITFYGFTDPNGQFRNIDTVKRIPVSLLVI